MKNLQTIVFIGRSGSGKGTQARLLQEHLSKIDPQTPILYSETGDLFRSFIESGSYSSKLSKGIINEGGLQPAFLAVLMWGNAFVEKITGNEHLIIDGTPRYLDEARILDTALDFYGRKAKIVYINISREEAIERLRARGREDDKSIEEINKRMDWFESSVVPAIEYYKNQDAHEYIEINGRQDKEKVSSDIISALGLTEK